MKRKTKSVSSESKAHPKDGERVRNIRKHTGKKQSQFAADLGISTGTFANYENARTEMTPSIWRQIFYFTGANPVPLDPEDDPRDVIKQIRARASVTVFAFRPAKDLLTNSTEARIAYGDDTRNSFADEHRTSTETFAEVEKTATAITSVRWRTAIAEFGPLPAFVDQDSTQISVLSQMGAQVPGTIAAFPPTGDLLTNTTEACIDHGDDAHQLENKQANELSKVSKIGSPIEYLRLLRRRSVHLRNNVYTPLRRRVTEACDFAYLTATLSFANEYVRRTYFDNGAEAGVYRDFIYVASAILIGVFIISIVRSIPWGIRLDETKNAQA